MTKIEQITYLYKCDICGTCYAIEESATRCEAKPMTHDKGIKVGDRVLITGGHFCEGEVAEVYFIELDNCFYGEKYHHTVVVHVKNPHPPQPYEANRAWPNSFKLYYDQYERDVHSMPQIRNVKV